jgi:5,10-methylenetetrahydrofolate reductase
VPNDLIEEMEQAEYREKKNIEIAARLIKEMKSMCYEVHIMAFGWERKVPEVLDATGL